jgi:hypothetical protein
MAAGEKKSPGFRPGLSLASYFKVPNQSSTSLRI